MDPTIQLRGLPDESRHVSGIGHIEVRPPLCEAEVHICVVQLLDAIWAKAICVVCAACGQNGVCELTFFCSLGRIMESYTGVQNPYFRLL